MAYINVAEWTTELVTDWLKGLDNSMYTYIKSFTNNEVRGQQLLNIRPYELEQLSMHSIGHQEIVLEAVEHLRNFHYHLDKENLQFLALQVATTAQCLNNQLAHFVDKSKIETQILSDITRTIATIKPLIGWLDRSPFQDKQQFVELRNKMFRYAIEMAMSAQRDRFVENPVDQIKSIALRVANLANYIIQDISDPMILQPAMLNLVTIKKKESELGFNIVPSYNGIHVVTDIKNKSPAHTSGKIEEGDEIVQVNYQTVVGWQYKKVIQQLQESPPDILLTLKKRPKHTKIYGQIYMKPYRLPSKKKALRWDTSPSPRPDLLHIQDFSLPLTQVTEKQEEPFDDDILDDADDILEPKLKKPSEKEIRLYLPKSRAVLQRRNTICGDHVMGFKNNVLFWHENRDRENSQESISQLRDKSVSFGFGLELATRPTTILGIGHSAHSRFADFPGLKGSMPEVPAKELSHIEESVDPKDEDHVSKPGISKVVRFDSAQIVNEYKDSQYSCNVDNTILEVFEPIPYVDDDDIDLIPIKTKTEPPKCDENVPPIISRMQKMSSDNGLLEAINEMVVNKCATRRGRLDKSHSTPIYDDTDEDSDVPPAIEPRKEIGQKTPPVPPRPTRPKRPIDVSPVTPSPISNTNTQMFVKANNIAPNDVMDDNKPKLATVIDLKNKENFHSVMEHLPERAESRTSSIGSTASSKKIPATKHFLEAEESELLTPNKTKSLTLKKKNSILAKRRNISLKTLEMGDIQGHLYRRAKDKNGVTYWAKPYFVLTDTSLYGFKTKDSSKADCLIFLLGFTVAVAPEVHSKPFAFKVYHQAKTFYFAAESQQALNQWMDYIRQATLKGNTATLNLSPNRNDKELFSETESSGDEFGLSQKTSQSPSVSNTLTGQQTTKKSGGDDASHSVGKHEKYNLGFNSLRKFTKNSLPFSSHKKDKEKLNSSDVPVPTAQYRTYRKVPGNAGLQLGTNSMISSTGTSDFIPPVLSSSSSIDTSYKIEAPKKASITAIQPTHSTAEPTSLHRYQREHTHHENRKLQKVSPCNYIHASNPNLLEFDFPTTKTLDFSYPKVNPSNSWDAHSNVQGFMTLKDLMLQKQEEEAQEMYNNRVLLGVEKKTSRNKRKQHRPDHLNSFKQDDDSNGGVSCKQTTPNKIQSRSLPKTPDYSHSFKPTDSDIKMIRSSEGQKLREFGYELISENDPIEKSAITNSEDPKPLQDKTSSGKKKGLNWINNERKSDDDRSNRTGSFKKSKRTLDSFKATEKLFPFKHKSSDNDLTGSSPKSTAHDKPMPLKPVTSYSPVTLPMNKKSAHVYNIEVDGAQPRHQVNLKKSSTYNSPDFHCLQSNENGTRKNSAPERSASYFTKLTFTSNKTTKEKKLLGSPRLHRAIFGRKESSETQHLDHELFDPVKTKSPSDTTQEYRHLPVTPKTSLTGSTHGSHSANSNDYPHLEYPPTFEPQTYSLSDPNTSLTMLRRRNNNQNK
ncbi:uncharacterized protein LOC119081403 isoform X1 [Bradysia coprophila]|uniref:uncharacterized protein LOC119081403 isoform X1 n=1 Tax=Bradysia coprophila TaxID=38358 RepID=UPI00187DAA03|nr:uncharacterized protein LOC119081403 isoform X1 [Bradysia coprophila]